MSDVIASIKISSSIDLSGFNRDLREMQRIGGTAGVTIGKGMASGISSQRGAINGVVMGMFQGVGIQVTQILTNAIGTGVKAGLGELGKANAVATEFQKMQKTLEFLSGGTKQAAAETAFLNKEIDRLNLPIQQVTEAYVALSAASKGTSLEGQKLRDIFSGIAQASRVYNLDAEKMEGALKAVEQMISKGNVSAEELRGQLGERLYGAFLIAARATNKTTAELNKMLQAGELIAEDFLPRFAKQLSAETRGGLAGAMETASAAADGLNNQITRSRAAFGQAFQPAVTATLNLFSDIIKNINVDLSGVNAKSSEMSRLLAQNPQIAKQIGDEIEKLAQESLNEAVKLAGDFLNYLKENPTAIADAGKEIRNVVNGLKEILTTAKQIGEFFIGWGDALDKAGQFLQKFNLPGVTANSGTTLFDIGAAGGQLNKTTGGFFGGGAGFIPRYNSGAARNANEQAILDMIIHGESGGRMNTVSQDGYASRGRGQFIPSTRNMVLQRTGIDAWGKTTTEQDKAILAYIKMSSPKAWSLLQSGDIKGAAAILGQREFYSLPGGKSDVMWNRPENQRFYQERMYPSGGIQFNNNLVGGFITRGGSKPTFPVAGASASQKLPGASGMMSAMRDGGKRKHNGIDYQYPTGTPLMSPIGGKVYRTAQDKGEYLVGIESLNAAGQKIQVDMAHLNRLNLKPGQAVNQGQLIGLSGGDKGSWGSTGAHLDLKVKVNGKPIDPQIFFGKEYSPGLEGAQGLESFQRSQQQALEESKRLLQERDRQNADRVAADRQMRDKLYSQETEKGRLGLTGRDLESYSLKRQGGADLQRLFDERADMEIARSIKLRDGIKGGVDYSAAIANQTKLIENQKQLNQQQLEYTQNSDKGRLALEGLLEANRNSQQVETAIAENRRTNFESWLNSSREALALQEKITAVFQEYYEANPLKVLDDGAVSFGNSMQLAAANANQLAGDFNQLVGMSMQPLIDDSRELAQSLAEEVGGGVKSLIKDLITGTNSLGETLLNFLGNMASSLADLALNSILGNGQSGQGLFGSLLGGLFGNGGDFGISAITDLGIPAFAKGGYTGGYEGLAYVHPNETIVPNTKPEDIMGNSMSVTNNITVSNNGGGVDANAQARQIAQEVERSMEKIAQREILKRSGGRIK